ncbi:MAG TPA: iron-sulfur cluster assembly accessory protein [Tepidisphaeraceae bacterium]|nr:iron-sulfur cluster assembly accessory protein [Tepidisphaeraceae bacterium]
MRRCILILTAVVQVLVSIVAFADAPSTRPSTQPARQIVSLTEKAAKEIKAVAATQNLPKYWLRVGVKAGEDRRRFSYVLDITEDRPDPKVDNVFDSGGVTVAVDDNSAIYLAGTVIDLRDDDAGKGFVFRNPNAVKE